jgi:hypothetical protein
MRYFHAKLGFVVELHSYHSRHGKMKWIEAEARSYAKPKMVVILRTAPSHSTFSYFLLFSSYSVGNQPYKRPKSLSESFYFFLIYYNSSQVNPHLTTAYYALHII